MMCEFQQFVESICLVSLWLVFLLLLLLFVALALQCLVQYLGGLASWLRPQAGMFMWMRLEGGVKDADDISDALKEELVAVVPGMPVMFCHATELLACKAC